MLSKKLIIAAVVATITLVTIVTTIILLNVKPTFEVRFNSEGIEVIEPVRIKEEWELYLPVLERDGYEFKYWYKLEDDKETIVRSGGDINSDTTLYAKWEKKSYFATFMDFDDNILARKSFLYDGKIGILNPVNKTGYTFDNWYDKKKH